MFLWCPPRHFLNQLKEAIFSHLRHLSDLRSNGFEPQISQMSADIGTKVRTETRRTVLGARYFRNRDKAEQFRSAENSPDSRRLARTVLAGGAEASRVEYAGVLGDVAETRNYLSGEPRFPHLRHLSDLRFQAGDSQITQMGTYHCAADSKPPTASFAVRRADP